MNLSKHFHGKPSEFVAQFIAMLRHYKKHAGYEFTLGKNYCAVKGSFRHISEPAAMLMYVTNLSFDEVYERTTWEGQAFEDYDKFMFAVDFMGDGVPWYMFQYLGLADKYVHPDHFWFLVDLNWKEHIKYLEDYWIKLNEAGL